MPQRSDTAKPRVSDVDARSTSTHALSRYERDLAADLLDERAAHAETRKALAALVKAAGAIGVHPGTLQDIIRAFHAREFHAALAAARKVLR